MCRLLGLLFVGFSPASFADDFDLLDGPCLEAATRGADVRAHPSLTIAQIGNLPNVVRGTSSALLLVRTDAGNLARILAAPAFRKSPKGGEPTPVLVIERLDTFAMPGARDRLARAKDLTLFDGFRLDLDTGGIVPEGQGGDLRFLASGSDGPRVVAEPDVTLWTRTKPPPSEGDRPRRPSPSRVVVPEDFNGRYRLFANGQTTGVLDLAVTDGDVNGTFRSDQTGTNYPLTGRVGPPSNAVRFTVELPRTKQEFEGHLFTEAKGAIAGTTRLLDRPFGFFAIRDGGRLAPPGDEVAGPADDAQGGRIVVRCEAGRSYLVDGVALDETAFVALLRERAAGDPDSWVLLRVPPTSPFVALTRILRVVRETGIDAIRVESLEVDR